MRALVLAAGVGSRLRPYTDRIPKPMLEVGGRPILSYNLDALASAGFDEVIVNLHYLPEVVRSYVGDGARWGMRVTYSEEATLLGTAGSLRPFEEFFRKGPFAIVFGDNLAEIDLSEMLVQHSRSAPIATIALWHRDDVSHSGVADVDSSGRILSFIEKPTRDQTHSHWVNAGFIVAEPALLDFVPPAGVASDLGRDVFPAVLRGGGILKGMLLRGGLWWFDRPEDYLGALADPSLAAFIASHSRGRVERSAEE